MNSSEIDYSPQGFLRPAPRSEPAADSVTIRRPSARTERVLGSPRKTPHNGTSGTDTSPARPGSTDAITADPVAPGADIFWNTSLRLVLEVLDQRRNPLHLRALLSPTVLEIVRRLAISDNPTRDLGAARTHRTHVHAASPSAAEVCATYRRGNRTFAIAARIENTNAEGWMITALHVV
ncbi:Rv3235 family protein [Rhodococcus sp. IEGM 1379]|uniref:Rv3235 family protein n=1 Tax=Rhodococcus sp. IEGM 1379 TaxID=3047086 RepID=UPI0024B75989|nr:Rv3235 family protein [Rhodococcus sp. IEGM 1379]MDI9918915.1 Rv3235 family protein [Rhodococcus sp. IEGM 1379]